MTRTLAASALMIAIALALGIQSRAVPGQTPPPAAAGGKHPYFDSLTARPDLLAAYSLRDPKQLDHPSNGGFAHSNKRPLVVVYDEAMDAAKITVGTGSNSLANQVRLPIPTHAPRSLFVTWDAWFGKEFEHRTHNIRNFKTFQFGSPFHDIHMEVRNRFELAPGTAGLIDGRLYPEGGYSVGPNVRNADTLEPRQGSFRIRTETWTRYWAFFGAPPGPDDHWYRYSLWAADEKTGPVLIYDRLKVRPSPKSATASWESFWLEYNTSTNPVRPGRPPLVAYARNVVALVGLADPRPLLIRP